MRSFVLLSALGIAGALAVGLVRARRRIDVLAETPGLERGRRYVLTLLIDPSTDDWGGVSNLTQASANVEALLGSPSGYGGWRANAAPTPATPADAAAMLAGRRSVWTFEATWTREERFATNMPDWLIDANARELSS